MKKILPCLCLLLVTGAITSCVAWEPSQPPLIRIENAHENGSKKLAFSPNGKYLASSGILGEIKIWSVPALRLLQTFSEHRDTPRGLVWLDDTTLASGDDDGRLLVWNATKNKILLSRNTPSPITSLIFFSNRNSIISGHRDGFVRAFSSANLYLQAEYDTGARVLSVATPPAENVLAVSSANRRIILLKTNLQSPRQLPPPPLNAVELAFSPNGKQLAGGNWFKLFFWKIPSGELKIVKSDHWGVPFSMDYTPDGHYLATIGRHTDSEIYLVDPQTGRSQRHYLRHKLCGAAVRISPDGRFLASASDDASIRLYDLAAPYKPVE